LGTNKSVEEKEEVKFGHQETKEEKAEFEQETKRAGGIGQPLVWVVVKEGGCNISFEVHHHWC